MGNFSFPHYCTIQYVQYGWKSQKFTLTFLWKQRFSKEVIKELISRKYYNFQVKQMAKSMGINSPIFMFDDDDENKPKNFVPKSVKRSSRRTTMLPPELNRTLNGTFTGKCLNTMQWRFSVKSIYSWFDEIFVNNGERLVQSFSQNFSSSRNLHEINFSGVQLAMFYKKRINVKSEKKKNSVKMIKLTFHDYWQEFHQINCKLLSRNIFQPNIFFSICSNYKYSHAQR